MMVIGLTGSMASGKSTLAAMLRKANIPVIDADELAREVTQKNSPLLAQLVKIFGPNILDSDHSLNRKKLAEIVFADEPLRKTLESILHPAINQLSQTRLQELAKKGFAIAVYMAPLIFEAKLNKTFDKTMLVVSQKELLLTRAHARDGMTIEQAQMRLKSQLDDDAKKLLADVVIDNNGSLKDLETNLTIAWKKLTGHALHLH